MRLARLLRHLQGSSRFVSSKRLLGSAHLPLLQGLSLQARRICAAVATKVR
jgi:hypothetical protein